MGLAAAATPAGLSNAGCGGVATDSHRAGVETTDGTGGSTQYVGRPAPETGGYPYAPGVGGAYPYQPGMGGTPGTGGYPYAPGLGGAYPYPRGTGGYPYLPGTGGQPFVGNTGGVHIVDAGPEPPRDAGPAPQDANVPVDGGDLCASGASGCEVACGWMGERADTSDWDCTRACAGIAPTAFRCEPFWANGGLWARCFLSCARRPQGLAGPSLGADDAVRAYFQEMSRLEAASVPAFRVLARELRAHGAPRSLIRAARRAARDEIRHARMGKMLAERFGGHYVRPRIATQPIRSIEAIATDNAVEGCVRETFGAVLATWQGRASADPVVRRTMRSVAVDETRHAAFNLRVAAWADRKMDAAARARVRVARRAAAERVLAESSYQPSPALVAIAGVPPSHEAKRLAVAMMKHLWNGG